MRSAATIAVAGFLLAGCFDQRALSKAEQQEQAWEESRPERYVMTYSFGNCECAGPYEIEVEVAGAYVRTVEYDDPHSNYDYDDVLSRALTIDDLFATARNAISESHRYRIGYDREWHYPNVIDIDWESDPQIMDAEIIWRVVSFRSLDP